MRVVYTIVLFLIFSCAFAQNTKPAASKKKSLGETIGLRPDQKPLIIVDGFTYKGNLDQVNTDSIESIDVLKGKDAFAIYGKAGKDGVILVTKKQPVATFSNERIDTVERKPLFIVNDTISRNEQVLYQLNPNSIEWIDVIKDTSKTNVYGKEGANGVVKIYTKVYVARSIQSKLSAASAEYKQYRINHLDKTTFIYVLNGKVLPDGADVFRLEPSSIKQVEFNSAGSTPTVKIITKD